MNKDVVRERTPLMERSAMADYNNIDGEMDALGRRKSVWTDVNKEHLKIQYRLFCGLAKNRWWHAEVFRNSSFRWGGEGRNVCR